MVYHAESPENSQIAIAQDVGAEQGMDEEHLSRPCPDSRQFCQLDAKFFIRECG